MYPAKQLQHTSTIAWDLKLFRLWRLYYLEKQVCNVTKLLNTCPCVVNVIIMILVVTWKFKCQRLQSPFESIYDERKVVSFYESSISKTEVSFRNGGFGENEVVHTRHRSYFTSRPSHIESLLLIALFVSQTRFHFAKQMSSLPFVCRAEASNQEPTPLR